MRGYGRGDGGVRAGRCEGRARELTQTYLQFLVVSAGTRGVEAAAELVVDDVAEMPSGHLMRCDVCVCLLGPRHRGGRRGRRGRTGA